MATRDTTERIADVQRRFETEVNAWVTSASATGDTWIIPLTFYWDGTHLVLATPTNSRTARDLRRAGIARLALGQTNDVILVEGEVTTVARDAIAPATADAHALRAGFDARTAPGDYGYLLVRPQTIRTWRGPTELADRVVMRNGRWLAPGDHAAEPGTISR